MIGTDHAHNRNDAIKRATKQARLVVAAEGAIVSRMRWLEAVTCEECQQVLMQKLTYAHVVAANSMGDLADTLDELRELGMSRTCQDIVKAMVRAAAMARYRAGARARAMDNAGRTTCERPGRNGSGEPG